MLLFNVFQTEHRCILREFFIANETIFSKLTSDKKREKLFLIAIADFGFSVLKYQAERKGVDSRMTHIPATISMRNCAPACY